MDIETLLKRIEELEARCAEWERKYSELEAKLASKNKDSNNSSKPPSQDPPGTKNKYPKREKSDKKPGGQKGHQGKCKNFRQEPDFIKTHEPKSCSGCGESLEGVEGKIIERRQEIDIPPIEPIITEHHLIEKTCPCCKHRSKGSFPDHIRTFVQFGLNVIMTVIYFNVVHHIPFQRTTKIFKEMFEMSISEGTIENILNFAELKALKYYDPIKEQLQKSRWVGSDETSIRINGQTWWRWVWQNDKFTYFASAPRRAYQVVKDFFGESFQGILLHDCYGAQLATIADKHQLCLAHLIREMLYLVDFEKSKWAFKMIRFFSRVIKAKEKIWSEDFDPIKREKVIKHYFCELDKLLDLVPIKKESHKIWKRLRKHKDKLLTFLVHRDVPATNNGSERAIRNAKIHRKISGCFRGNHAPQRHSVLLSVLETAKKQGYSLLDSCKLMLNQQLVLQG